MIIAETMNNEKIAREIAKENSEDYSVEDIYGHVYEKTSEPECYQSAMEMAKRKDDYYKNILDDNDKRMRRIADCNIAYSKLYCDANEEMVYMAQKLECAWKLFERHATYKDPSTGETICIMTKDQFMDQIKELWEKD